MLLTDIEANSTVYLTAAEMELTIIMMRMINTNRYIDVRLQIF